MSDLMELLNGALGGYTTSEISRKLGADDRATGNAIQAAVPMLMAALHRNSSDPRGADALHQTLTRDHDGSLLDNLSGFLGNAESDSGPGFLRNVLGEHQDAATNAISRSSGLDVSQVTKLLAMVAPIALGALGRMQRQQNLDARGLSSALQTQTQQMTSDSPDLMSMATHLLDGKDDLLQSLAGGLDEFSSRIEVEGPRRTAE